MTSLVDRTRAIWDIDPQVPAVFYRDHWCTWSDLTGCADELETHLGCAGLDQDHPYVIALENRPSIIAAVLGGVAHGRRVRFVNSMQSPERLHADLEQLGPSVLVATTETAERVGGRPGSRIVVLADDGSVVRAADHSVPEAASRPEEDDVAGSLELFTSGTTGPPKRITLTVRQLQSALDSVSAHHGAPPPGKRPSSPSVIATPIAHIGGLWGILQSLVSARPFVMMDRFTVQDWVAVVVDHRPKTAGLPPTALRMILDADVPKESIESIRAINAGTAPLDPELVDTFLDRYGIPILNVYGATEFAGAVAGWSLGLFREWWTEKRGSVGRPQPGVQMRVVAADGKPVSAGGPGVLEIKAGQTGRDTWVRTHDRARIDADGFLWIDGRADDVIIRGGFKIDPAVVRRVLERHPGVGEAAVHALPDRRLGQVPVAAVETATGAATPEVEELRQLCRDTLAPYEVPTQFRVVHALPRTPSMKVSSVDVLALFSDDKAANSALVS